MSRFLEAAQKVLRKEQRPMTAKEIVKKAMAYSLLTTNGETPEKTLISLVSSNIRKLADNSPFMRTSPGTFALREWKSHINEYQSKKFHKKPFKETIAVFNQTSLDKLISRPGLHGVFIPESFYPEIYPMQRTEAEERYDVIQLVSVFIVSYNEQFITYKRSKRLPENRLHGQYSIIFGGHLTPEDFGHFSLLFDPLNPDDGLPFVLRELEEEIHLKDEPRISRLGLIYDDTQSVSRQHLGIIYKVLMTSKEFTIGEKGFLIDSKFESLEKITSRIDDFENWSVRIAKYLNQTRDENDRIHND